MTVQDICIHLGISRASYYRWKKNLTKDHPKRHLEKQIGTLCREHKYRYGYRKITAILKRECVLIIKRFNVLCRKINGSARLR